MRITAKVAQENKVALEGSAFDVVFQLKSISKNTHNMSIGEYMNGVIKNLKKRKLIEYNNISFLPNELGCLGFLHYMSEFGFIEFNTSKVRRVRTNKTS